MKECVQDKFFISFLIFIGGFSYFIGLSNNKQIKEVLFDDTDSTTTSQHPVFSTTIESIKSRVQVAFICFTSVFIFIILCIGHLFYKFQHKKYTFLPYESNKRNNKRVSNIRLAIFMVHGKHRNI